MKDIGDHHSRAGDPARVERAQRLLATARLAPPPTTVTFAEIEAAIHARRWAGLPAPVRWLVGGAVALCPVLALGSLAVSHGWLTTTTTTTTVPARVTAPAGTTKTSRASRGGAPARRPDAAATAPSAELPPASAPAPAPAGAPAPAPAPSAAPRPKARGEAPSGTPTPSVRARPTTTAMGTVAVVPRAERAHTAGVDTTPPAPGAVAEPSGGAAAPAADEIGTVRDALERLRGEKDAAGALQRLDDYDRRFPAGLLSEEASTIRIEALLVLGRRIEALARLDALPSAVLDRSPRLRVTRGELRVAAGRCPEAVADFATVITAGAGGEIKQRAERGRVACNFGAGRHTGATGGDR